MAATNAKYRGLNLCARPTGSGSGERHCSWEAGNSSFLHPGTSTAPCDPDIALGAEQLQREELLGTRGHHIKI